MKELNKTASKIFRDILNVTKDGYLKLNNGGAAIMPAIFEKINSNVFLGQTPGDVWSVAHYFEQNGDLCKDPVMTFWVSDLMIIALSFEMNGTILERYEVSVSIEDQKLKGYKPKMQKDHTTFANQWFKNIFDQQLRGKKIEPQKPEPVTTETENKDLELYDYSERAFALFGDYTILVKDELSHMGGTFNRFLKRNGIVTPGWIFSKKRLDDVKKFLSLSTILFVLCSATVLFSSCGTQKQGCPDPVKWEKKNKFNK